jgi:hypothetical protein
VSTPGRLLVVGPRDVGESLRDTRIGLHER